MFTKGINTLYCVIIVNFEILFKKLTIGGNAIDELSHVFVIFHRG